MRYQLEGQRFYVYVLECEAYIATNPKATSLYTGWTTCVEKRFNQHCSGKGARYTRAFKPINVSMVVECSSKSSAMKVESFIKRMSATEKRVMVDEWSRESAPRSLTSHQIPISSIVGFGHEYIGKIKNIIK